MKAGLVIRYVQAWWVATRPERRLLDWRRYLPKENVATSSGPVKTR